MLTLIIGQLIEKRFDSFLESFFVNKRKKSNPLPGEFFPV